MNLHDSWPFRLGYKKRKLVLYQIDQKKEKKIIESISNTENTQKPFQIGHPHPI